MRVNKLLISELLEKYKYENKCTNIDIANAIGKSENTVKALIGLRTTPDLNTLIKLCILLKKDANTFIIYEEKDNIILSEIKELKITDGNKYLVDRFEELIIENKDIKKENSDLKEKLSKQEKNYPIPPHQDLAAEESAKLKKSRPM